MADALDRGRSAVAGQAWAEAHQRLSAADQAAPLEPDDLERLATAAFLVGREEESTEAWARAHQELLARGETGRAARCAFWVAFGLLNRGELARGAAGWPGPGGLLAAGGASGLPDSAEHGYLRWLVAFQSYMAGETAAARAGFEEAAAIGDRWGEPDLAAMSRLGVGRALIKLGQTGPGVALLDEVMAAVEAGELSPVVVGDLYCSVIEGCQELFDLRRAQQWTAVLTAWCAGQPDLVPYRGQCLLHRAELLTLHGAWPDAMEEARRASARFLEPTGHPAAGAAAYQQAELHRLRGETTEAEEAYRRASRWAGSPSPAWPCCGWPRGRPRRPRRRSAGSLTRPPAGRTGAGCCRPLWRSPWPAATWRPPGRRPRSWTPPPASWTRRCCGPRPPTPRAPSCWPRATPWPPWPRCAAAGGRGGSWRRRTRRPGPGC